MTKRIINIILSIISIAILITAGYFFFIKEQKNIKLEGSHDCGYEKSVYSFNDDIWHTSRHAMITDKDFKTFKKSGLNYNSAEEFLFVADNYVKCIIDYTGTDDWYLQHGGEDDLIKFDHTLKITINVSLESKSYAANTSVFLSKYSIGKPIIPLTHELTHVITYYGSSPSLIEGLAEYMQVKLTGSSTLSKQTPIYIETRSTLPDYEAILPLIGESRTVYLENHDLLKDGYNLYAYYIFSHSFTKFLIDEFGIEKFMELYYSLDLVEDYKRIYQKSLDELKLDWLETVEAYE